MTCIGLIDPVGLIVGVKFAIHVYWLSHTQTFNSNYHGVHNMYI